jgi:hypothetical protein
MLPRREHARRAKSLAIKIAAKGVCGRHQVRLRGLPTTHAAQRYAGWGGEPA